MPSAKNINQLQQLKQKADLAKSVVLVDYCGLNVEQMTSLRQKIKEMGGEFKVAKNTLINLALKNSLKQKLTKSTAVLFSYQDEVSPIKALYEFSRKNDLPKIKLGFLAGSLLEKDKIIALAKLPGKETLQAQLIGALNSPLYGLVFCLKGNMQKLINLFKELSKIKKENI